MSRKPRQERATFSLAAVRRREVERHARHVGAADTEDFWRWLVAWSWHNRDSRDNAGALVLAAERMGGTLSGDEAVKALDQADDMPQHRSADRLARFLGVTFPQRQVLGIKTIGAIDLNRRARLFLRRRKRRADFEANSLSRTKPWEQAGMSRATWYRKRSETGETGPRPIIPTPTDGCLDETGPRPILLSSRERRPVSPERKQEGEFGGSGVVCEDGILLTRRWVAARARACGCRHNRSLSRDLYQPMGTPAVGLALRADLGQRSAKKNPAGKKGVCRVSR